MNWVSSFPGNYVISPNASFSINAFRFYQLLSLSDFRPVTLWHSQWLAAVLVVWKTAAAITLGAFLLWKRDTCNRTVHQNINTALLFYSFFLLYAYACACVCVSACVCTCAFECVFTCVCVCVHACVSACMCVCMHVCLHACVCVGMRVRMRVSELYPKTSGSPLILNSLWKDALYRVDIVSGMIWRAIRFKHAEFFFW